MRLIGQRRIATLKGAATVRDGMYERDEWEAEIGPSDDPADWPAGELRDRVLALLGGAPVAPELSMRTLRHHVYAERGGARVAELSLDEGDISAGGLAQHFRELEAELLRDGTRADLDELVGLLRARFPLAPENRSKLARGLALLDEANARSTVDSPAGGGLRANHANPARERPMAGLPSNRLGQALGELLGASARGVLERRALVRPRPRGELGP
ncbi:hypothetical protein [Kouleothrix sp.]|uniref:hypothetical protein n=1 Tax=Kouleothrix sp. TaxID=2779161 RepID=UPI00391DC650